MIVECELLNCSKIKLLIMMTIDEDFYFTVHIKILIFFQTYATKYNDYHEYKTKGYEFNTKVA